MIVNTKIRRNIVENIIPHANAILIFTLILSGNYLDDFFPCKVQNLMRNNLVMKHLVGFMILYFLTILAIPELKSIKGIGSAVILYILFLLSTKINYIAWAVVLFIYVIIYLLNIIVNDLIIKKESIENNSERKKKVVIISNLKRVMAWLFIINVIIIITGFIYYYKRKHVEYGKKFTIKRFFFGLPDCKHIQKNNLYKK